MYAILDSSSRSREWIPSFWFENPNLSVASCFSMQIARQSEDKHTVPTVEPVFIDYVRGGVHCPLLPLTDHYYTLYRFKNPRSRPKRIRSVFRSPAALKIYFMIKCRWKYNLVLKSITASRTILLTLRMYIITQRFGGVIASNGSGWDESNTHSTEAGTRGESCESNSWQNGGKKIPLFLWIRNSNHQLIA